MEGIIKELEESIKNLEDENSQLKEYIEYQKKHIIELNSIITTERCMNKRN